MTTRKAQIARTYAPIHFDDLDPHRFEDLVRELIYDFRDWQTIEATGRAGGDDGFDIRAFEKVIRAAPREDDESEDDIHPMDGRRWMIQGKREKTITPADIKKYSLTLTNTTLPTVTFSPRRPRSPRDHTIYFEKSCGRRG
jgi:hypothetical protein